MRPTALFLTALVLGGLVAYLLTNGRKPSSNLAVVSLQEVPDRRAEIRAERAAAHEPLLHDEIQRVLRIALPARFPQQNLEDSDYTTLSDIVLRIRAAQRALRTADTDRTRTYLEGIYFSPLQEALSNFQRITGMTAAELDGLLGSKVESEHNNEATNAPVASKPTATREGDFVWPLTVATLLMLVWLLKRTFSLSRSPATASPPQRGVPILPSKEPAATANAITIVPGDSVVASTSLTPPAPATAALPEPILTVLRPRTADQSPSTKAQQSDRAISRSVGETITSPDIAENLVVTEDLSETRLQVLIERFTGNLADEKLLEREAGRRSLSVDGLLQTVEAEAQPANDKDIEAYFAEHRTEINELTSRERVAHCISLQRRIERRVQFRFALRQQASFEFLYEGQS